MTNRSGQLNVLLGQTQTVVAMVRLDASSHDSPANFAVAQARADRDKAKKNEKDAHAQFERWKRFAGEFAQGQRAFLQLDILEKNRLELSQSIPSAEDQEAVERRLRETNLSLTQLRQQLNTSTDRWQRWGAEVRAQAPNWTKQSICPLCGYDHQSPAQLRSAIDDVLSRQPLADADTATRLAQLESAIAELRSSAATIAERRKQLLELEKKIVDQKDGYARFLTTAKERGFDEQLFARVDASEFVASRLRMAEETATTALKFAERQSARAADVDRWHSQLRDAAQKLRAALSIQSGTPDSLPTDPSLQERLQDVEALVVFAQTQAETFREQTERANRSAEEWRAKLSKLDAGHRDEQELLETLARKADEMRKLVESVGESWRVVSSEPLESASLLRVEVFQ